MDNTRCQSCHTQQYTSFATDHPDFAMWPYERRTRIAFNHALHSGKYFPEKQREFTCQQCHMEDETRNVQLTLGYEAACADCHDADIATSTAAGIELLAMPMLDVEALADAGHDVGDWPEQANGDFDGKLPAMMKLLLVQNDKARAAMQILGADFDFFDIDLDEEAQIKAAGELAMAINGLLDDLTSVEKRRDEEVLRGLPAMLVRQARERWLAGDSTEGEPQAGEWFADDRALSLRYQPMGHADPVLKGWLEAVVALPAGPFRAAMLAELAGPTAAGRCTSCHSMDEQDSRLTIHWRAHDRRQQLRGFTKFSHAPHLLPVELRDCTACHALRRDASTATSYTGHNPSAFASDFLPLSKATCATCHNRAAVGEACTQCHNYHVESLGL